MISTNYVLSLFCFEGKRHAYSNLGYTVLGQVIERITGQGYEEFMLRILKRVGINQMKIGRTRKKDLDAEEVRFTLPYPPPPKKKQTNKQTKQSKINEESFVQRQESKNLSRGAMSLMILLPGGQTNVFNPQPKVLNPSQSVLSFRREIPELPVAESNETEISDFGYSSRGCPTVPKLRKNRKIVLNSSISFVWRKSIGLFWLARETCE